MARTAIQAAANSAPSKAKAVMIGTTEYFQGKHNPSAVTDFCLGLARKQHNPVTVHIGGWLQSATADTYDNAGRLLEEQSFGRNGN